MGYREYPAPTARRYFAQPNAVHYWRLDDPAAPFTDYGLSPLPLKNTGNAGTVTANKRAILSKGISTAISSGSTRNTIYTDAPAVAGDIVTGTALSVSAWVFPRNVSGLNQVIAIKQYDSNLANWGANAITWGLLATGGTAFPNFQVVTGTAGSGTLKVATSTFALRPYEWQLLAGSYDGVNVNFYWNGSLVTATACTGNLDNSLTNSSRGGAYCVNGAASTNASANGLNANCLTAELIVENVARGEEWWADRYLRGIGLIVNGGFNPT